MAKTVNLFGIDINVIERREATDEILTWIHSGKRKSSYVVTPNVDHVIQYQKNDLFREAYANASMVLADGKPVVWASKILGKPLPETVTGSDLLPDILFRVCCQEDTISIFLLGAGPGVAEKAKHEIERRWKKVKVAGVYSPPFGFEKDLNQTKIIVEKVNKAQPDLLVVGLGAPKQEIWTLQNYSSLKVKVILCIGATIDFLAQEKKRAPIWMQTNGLEWLYRLLCEPHRLFPRYAGNFVEFPKLLFIEWIKKFGN